MDLRLLRYFVAVAEERNVTAAARRLHLSQPGLSQQIKLLERTMGTLLLDRSAQPLRLTPAGDELLAGAYRLLDAAADVDRSVKATAEGRTGLLRIGTTWGGLYNLLLPAMRDLRAERPGVLLPVTQYSGPGQLAALRRGEVDVLLHRTTHRESFAGVERRLLFDDPLLALLPIGHPAGLSGAVHLPALADERFVMINRQIKPLVFDRCAQLCRDAGFEMNVVEQVEEPMALALAVGSSNAVSLTGAGMASRYPGVDYLLVEPLTAIAEVSVTWLPSQENPLLEPFVAFLTQQQNYW